MFNNYPVNDNNDLNNNNNDNGKEPDDPAGKEPDPGETVKKEQSVLLSYSFLLKFREIVLV